MGTKIDIKLLKKNAVFEHEDDYIMYILVNTDINMNLEQMLSQCSESIIKVVRANEQKYNVALNYTNWAKSDESKIFLKATQEDLLYAFNNYSCFTETIWCQHSLDLNDLTSPFTITSVAFTPMMRKDTPKFILDLKSL